MSVKLCAFLRSKTSNVPECTGLDERYFSNQFKSFFLLVIVTFLVSGCATSSSKQTVTVMPTDFNGVWQIVGWDEVIRPESDESNFTDQAKERIKHFEEKYDKAKDAPAKLCYFSGMPWTVLTRARTYGIEIYQTNDRLLFLNEGMDLVRHIRFNVDQVPEGFISSNQGYSIAHWEDNELVIKTTNITPTYEINPKMRSEEATIVERWRKYQHEKYGEVIEINLLVDDPEIYLTPAKGRQLLQRAPEGTVLSGYDCANALWEDYIDQRTEETEKEKKPR